MFFIILPKTVGTLKAHTLSEREPEKSEVQLFTTDSLKTDVIDNIKTVSNETLAKSVPPLP